jgi:hypothetical protein
METPPYKRPSNNLSIPNEQSPASVECRRLNGTATAVLVIDQRSS